MSRKTDSLKAGQGITEDLRREKQGRTGPARPGGNGKNSAAAAVRRRHYLPKRRPIAVGLLSFISIAALTGSTAASMLPNAAAGARKTAASATVSSYKCSATGSTATARLPVQGAAANGSADDTAAIQHAINIAGQRGGGIVTLPAGTFMINGHLVMRNNVDLTGAGPSTVIKAGPRFLRTEGTGYGYPIISTAGASNTTISNLTADQSGDTLRANVRTRLYSYVVEGRRSSNVIVNNVYVRNPFTYSIAMVASTDFCVENSNVQVSTGVRYNQLDGIHILDSNSGQVINNVVKSGDDGLAAHTTVMPVYDVLFADNKVHGGPGDAGLQLAVGGASIYNITVAHNEFYGSLFGVYTGYWGDRVGNVRNVTISDNYIHDLINGNWSRAVQIGDAGQPGSITYVTATGNSVCNAGKITIQPGLGNSVTGTTGCR
jgi:polygalacturonase